MRNAVLTLLAGVLTLGGALLIGFALGTFSANDPTVPSPTVNVVHVPLTEATLPVVPVTDP